MKSLRRLFAVVAPLLLVGFITGCSGLPHPTTKTLTSIAVTPATPANLKVGATQQFTATGTYSDSSTADITATVTWASGTPATATITASGGLATGVASGTTSITATLGTVTSPGVTLTVISLTSIAITPNPASVAVGSTISFIATGTYSDASTSNITTQVTWSSSPIASATIVATTGVATGVANGTAQISAVLGSIVAPSVTLTVGTGGVPVPVAVKIVQTNPTIPVGGVEDFTAVALLSDGTTAALGTPATWSSGTTATATILATSGIASGVAQGTSTITASSGTLAAGTTVLTVAPGVLKFLYTVSFENGVAPGYAINSAASALAPLPSAFLQALSPTQLVFEPSGQFAYAAASIQSVVGIFAINSASGTFTDLVATDPTDYSNPGIPSFVSGTSVIAQSVVDPTGRFLYVLDTGTGFVNAYSIDTNNSATSTTKGALAQILTGPTIATGAGATGIVMDPLGRFVYVTNGGASSSITGYSIAADGHLTPVASIGSGPFTSLSDPQIPAIDPTGSFLFVPNGTGSTVSAFSISTAGALTLINPVVTSNINAPFQAVVDPAGKFLFVTNDGDGTVAAIPIGAGGVLGTTPTTTPTGLTSSSFPAGLAIDNSGAFLAVVNNGDNTVALFTVANGVLTPKFVAEATTIPEFVSFYSGLTSPVIGPSNVFAANSGTGNISGFTASSATGALTAGGSPTAGITGNSILLADSTGTLLFNSSPANLQFDAFNVTPSTAALSVFSGSPFTLRTPADAPSEIATEPTSRFIFVADTTASVVEAFSVGNPPVSLGTTTPLVSVNTVVGDPQGTLLYALGLNVINPVEINLFTGAVTASGVPVAQLGNWTSGAIDPSGHWMVALDAAGKALQSFQITPVQTFSGSPDGDLTSVGSPLATAVAAPSSVTFDPQARFVFVSDATNGTVTAFGFNNATGAVTTTGKTTTVSATGTGKVSIDASGTYLYAAVTGNGGSTPSGVNAYKINSDGSLTLVIGSPFATGAGTTGTAGVVVTGSVK